METPAFSAEIVERPGGLVALCILRGSKSLNVVDQEAMLGMADGIRAIQQQHPTLRCMVLTGPTERAFIGGANLHALRGLNRDTAEAFIRSVHEVCKAIRTARVPVIARMQGYCLGAGLEIAAACDMRIGDMSVYCGMPEVKVGVPSVVEACLLPGLIGWGKARELMLRGNILDASASFKTGLLQHLCGSDELGPLQEEICADICAAAPDAIAAQKQLFMRWEDESASRAIESGVTALVDAYASDEPQRYIDKFFAEKKA